MVHVSTGDRLTLEARDELRKRLRVRAQDLDCDALLHVDVLAAIDGAYAAGCEDRVDAVSLGDGPAYERVDFVGSLVRERWWLAHDDCCRVKTKGQRSLSS